MFKFTVKYAEYFLRKVNCHERKTDIKTSKTMLEYLGPCGGTFSKFLKTQEFATNISSFKSPDLFVRTSREFGVWQVGLPDDGDELGHGELVRHQELGFVQRWEIFLPFIALDDDLQFIEPGQSSGASGTGSPLSPHTYRDLVGEFGPDSRHLLLPGRCGWRTMRSRDEDLCSYLSSFSRNLKLLPKFFRCLNGLLLICGRLWSGDMTAASGCRCRR